MAAYGVVKFVGLFECLGRTFQLFLAFNVVEMHGEPVLEAVFCLSYVLFIACGASDTVDEIVALACDLLSGVVCTPCGVAGYVASMIQSFAVTTVPGFTFVKWFTRFG